MANYVDSSTQTIIAGLTKHPAARPAVLCDDTTTPPDEMATEKLQLPAEGMPAILQANIDNPAVSPTLLLRRKKRPSLVARISLPALELDPEGPRSPPPTQGILSPLPAANKLHAGHTPIIPRSLSPFRVHDDQSGPSTPTPEQDEALSGPLTLPPQPGDGTEDRIPLQALDAELEKIAKEQELASQKSESTLSPSENMENGGPKSGKGTAEAPRRSPTEEVFDGVILKKPVMNFGAPLGQA